MDNIKMAIYHLSVKPVQRSKGRSSTAAAAYRAGCEIEGKRTGLKHDYTKKQGVEHTEIITPDGVDIPSRSDLWNLAEAAEKRKDGCTAREYEVNLPYELDEKQRTELAQDFCKQLAKIHGIAVDLCIHKPTDKEIAAGADARNHHAHILTTTRKITNEGLTDKADIEKSGRKRKDDLKNTRELWAVTANKHFEMAGLAERIDSRSLKDQGSALKPTIKMGKVATQMERDPLYTPKGKEPRPKYNTFKGDINRAIKSDNDQIKTLENELYLDKGRLSAQQKILDMRAEREEEQREVEENRHHEQERKEEKTDEPEPQTLTLAEKHELWKADRIREQQAELEPKIEKPEPPKAEPIEEIAEPPPTPSRGFRP